MGLIQLKQSFIDWLFKDTKIRKLQTGTNTITLSDVIQFPDHSPAHTPTQTGEIGFKAEQDTGGEDRITYWDRDTAGVQEVANKNDLHIVWKVETELLSNGTFSIDISGEDDVGMLCIFYECRDDSANTNTTSLLMRFNTSTGNYDSTMMIFKRDDSTVGSTSQDGFLKSEGLGGRIPGGNVDSNYFGTGQVNIHNPFATDRWKSWQFWSYASEHVGNTTDVFTLGGGVWEITSKIITVKFAGLSFGNLEAGSKVIIYGMGGTPSI